jgi:hypothetical protein
MSAFDGFFFGAGASPRNAPGSWPVEIVRVRWGGVFDEVAEGGLHPHPALRATRSREREKVSPAYDPLTQS